MGPQPVTPHDALLITSEQFAAHVPPDGHPERPERAVVMSEAAAHWVASGGVVQTPGPVTTEDLARVHDDRHIETVGATAGRRMRLDPDTYTSPDSEQTARLAAGAAVAAVDHAVDATAGAAAFVRPPGHHAEADRAMGFCLYNNVAVAAAHALSRGLARVAVVDYDVHHGNGTQAIFYDDPQVLYLSLHQYPFYPGTGAATEIGTGDGEGLTVNVPLEAGAGDADYDLVFREVVGPVLEMFSPEAILLSAGFDAHARDPLGGMRVSTDGYTRMTQWIRASASGLCEGRLVIVTEGGYDLEALGACLEATLGVLRDPPTIPSGVTAGSTTRGAAALTQVRQAVRPFWPGL